jgi:uncharacterized coiled-coil protein SlyX/DNA-directed RNA polymerase subunit RPC12/RpoP
MAEAEPMIVMCDKCGARLKLKPMQVQILSEVKCGKCGNRIPTSTAVPASLAPPASIAMPLSEATGEKKPAPPPIPAPAPKAAKPAPPPPPPAPPPAKAEDLRGEPPPVDVPAASLVVPAKPVAPVRAPTPHPAAPKERTQTIKSRTANFGPAPGVLAGADSDSPAMLKQKIAELEDEVNIFRQQIQALESQIAEQQQQGGRFQELLQRAADAEERCADMQEQLQKKDKDYHTLETTALTIQHERDEAYAMRESVLENIKDLLATYHSTEIEAARKRLGDLDVRIDRFVSLIRQRNAPAAPAPSNPIPEAAEHSA